MAYSDQPVKTRVAVENSFAIESGHLGVLELTLSNFGCPKALAIQCDTEGVKVAAMEVIPKRQLGYPTDAETTAIIALEWPSRPSMVRLVCRSEKITAAIAVSNFETTSLAQFAAMADGHRLLAIAGILRHLDPELLPAHGHVVERIRKLGRRDSFLNWLPAPEDRFVCLVLQAGPHDPAGLGLMPLHNSETPAEWLLPVSCSTADNHLVLLYDLRRVIEPSSPVELAAVVHEKLHYWRLEPRSDKSPTTDAEHLAMLCSRWTERVCESIAIARCDLLMDQRWDVSENALTGIQYQPEIDPSVLVVTDVVDMFSLTSVMAAAELWKERFGRILLLLPSWRVINSPQTVDPLALIEEFGGTGIIEPITTNEFNVILQSLELGASVSFASAAAPYNTPIDGGCLATFPITTFELTSRKKLQNLKKIVRYSVLAGGPLVWRELQCAFSNSPVEGISIGMLSESRTASLVDDLYAAPCAKLGWPLGAMQHFDRQMFAAFRNGDEA